ncbi:ionotropic receptor 75a-like [Arctopsyche grandis]|uniref:ionotropic receptor 75a-like n=1 Tax=Arctopsyche grandis TaxID=121162 RepID=UPI00406D69A4
MGNTSSDINMNLLEGLNILPDSDFNVILENEDGDILDPLSVYKRNETQELVIEKSSRIPLAKRRINLESTLIKICYVLTNNDTINHLSDYLNKEVDTITKVNFILTNHLIDFLNGSRSFSFVSSWGYKDVGDGSWSGMIGQLTKKEADIGGSPLFFTADRVPVIDYIAMPTPTRSKFVFRQPKLSYMSNVFLLPFRGGVWGCSAGLVVILVFFLYLSSKWEWKSHTNPEQGVNDSETLRASWSDAAILTIGAICQQGSNVQLKGPVGRIVILLLFLSLMFLYTSYSANIVALLQSSSSRIKTLSDLSNSRLKFAVHDTVFNRHYFSTATEPVRKMIYQKKIAPPGEPAKFTTLDDGVRKLRDGLFAFHMETGVGYKVVNEIFHEGEKCGLQEIQYLQVIDPWLAIQKDSCYKEMFKIGLRRIQEYGLQARENWLLYTKKPKCSGTGSNFISVGIVDCRPAMMVLAYGGLVSILILILEYLLHYRVFSMRKQQRERAKSSLTHSYFSFSIKNHS